MDFKGLFDALANYLNFVIDLVYFSGMETYAGNGKISSILVSHCIVGVFIAYLMSIVKVAPGYEKVLEENAPKVESTLSKDSINMPDMAQFVLITILTGFGTHIGLAVYSCFFDQSLQGSIHDTINAILAYNAFLHPLNVTVRKVMLLIKMEDAESNFAIKTRVFYAWALVSIIFYSFVYYFYALASVHKTTMWSAFVASVGSFAVVFLIFMIFSIPYKWPKDDEEDETE